MSRIPKINAIFLYFIVFSMLSCTKEVLTPDSVFLKVYDNEDSDRSFYPVDIVELAEGGFYVLFQTTMVNNSMVSGGVMCLDKAGNTLWMDTLAAPYVNPIGSIVLAEGNYGFFCMNFGNTQSEFFTIDKQQQRIVYHKTLEKFKYPLAVSQTPDKGFILLSYNKTRRESKLTKLNAKLDETWTTAYFAMEDVDDIFSKHRLKKGKELPFFTGTVGNGKYYFANGFDNYTLSTFFVDASGRKTVNSQGYRYEAGFSALLPLTETTFAAMSFFNNDHFGIPFLDDILNKTISIKDLESVRIPETTANSNDRILRFTQNGEDRLVLASSTNSNQIILLFYDVTNSKFLGQKVYGFGNPVKLASIIETSDDALMLLMETMVFGKFRRVALQKIPKQDFEF